MKNYWLALAIVNGLTGGLMDLFTDLNWWQILTIYYLTLFFVFLWRLEALIEAIKSKGNTKEELE